MSAGTQTVVAALSVTARALPAPIPSTYSPTYWNAPGGVIVERYTDDACGTPYHEGSSVLPVGVCFGVKYWCNETTLTKDTYSDPDCAGHVVSTVTHPMNECVRNGDGGNHDDPFVKYTQCRASETQEPSHHVTTEEPSHHVTTEEPSHHVTTEEPSHHVTTEEPSHHVTTQEPSHHVTTEEPSHHVTTEEPSHHVTTEEPSHAPAVPTPTMHPTGTLTISHYTDRACDTLAGADPVQTVPLGVCLNGDKYLCDGNTVTIEVYQSTDCNGSAMSFTEELNVCDNSWAPESTFVKYTDCTASSSEPETAVPAISGATSVGWAAAAVAGTIFALAL